MPKPQPDFIPSTPDFIPATGSTTTPQDTQTATPGPLDQLSNWAAKTFPNISKKDAATSESDALNPTRGTAPELSRMLVNAGSTAVRGAASMPAGIANWVKQGFDPEQDLHPVQYEQKRLMVPPGQPGTTLTAGQHPAEPTEENYADEGSRLLGNGALGLATGEAVGGMLKLPGAAKNFMRGDVDAPVAGSTTTPRMRYDAAKRLGVNLDAADATGSPLLGNVKRVGENSLAGGHLYDASKAANTGALQSSTDDFLNGMHEGDRESGGKLVLDALQRDQQGLRKNAEGGFDQLTEQTKGQPVKGAPAVGKTASTLLKTIEPLAEKYPSLAPGKTIHVLNDLTSVGGAGKPAAPNFLDAPGSEFAAPRPMTPPQPDTWSDLQRLRSATHDLTTTNPDLVKSQAIAPLQQMTSSLDDAMTNASSGLTPQQESVFRRANADWKDMKATYDDPSSPFYHAVRTDNPSTLFGGVGPKTPENAINLRNRLSPFETYPEGPSPALGAVRRGTVESALKPNNEGNPSFKNFGTQWNRIPADYRAELFSPDQNATLRDVNLTSNALAKDFNPSGSGKLGQKVGEAAAMVPMMGAPLLQYPVAKMMTSPRVVDWLMRPSTTPNRLFAPGSAILAGTSSEDRKAQRGDQ